MVVLATITGYPAGVRVQNQTGWFSPGCYPENRGTYRVRGWVRTGPLSHLTVAISLLVGKYLNSDHIAT